MVMEMRFGLVLVIVSLVLISGCVTSNGSNQTQDNQSNQTQDLVLEVSEVLANKDQYLGKPVSVKGLVSNGPAICTQIFCSPNEPCCNSCAADIVIGDKISIRGELGGKAIGCGGNECDLNCGSFEPGKSYKVTGGLTEEYGQLYIDLESFEQL